MDVFCGIDWAEGHHDVAIIDSAGKLLAKCRISDDLDGYQVVLDLLAEHGDSSESPIPVAVETSRGLLVATLRTGARQIFAVNPMAASRYRDSFAARPPREGLRPLCDPATVHLDEDDEGTGE